jgi:hypothetical protein
LFLLKDPNEGKEILEHNWETTPWSIYIMMSR